jgi:membrane protease subunit HflK
VDDATERTPDGAADPSQPSCSIWSDMCARMPQVRRAFRIIVLAVIALYAASGVYVVQPDERGVVRRFGRVVADGIQPGIHYRIPWPIDRVSTPQVTSIKRMSVGYKIVDQIRGVQPQPRESQFLTGDSNIIEIQLLIQYVVKDASDFLFATEEPQWLVRRAGESALTEKVGSMGVDDVLTTEKIAVETTVMQRVQEILDSYGTGIEIVAAHLQGVTPPREVAEAFRDVASAREDRSRIIEEADGYANQIIPTARGDAAGMLSAAEGYKSEKVSTSEGDAARFATMLTEYRAAKEATRERVYLETMETVLSRVKKYVLDAKAGAGKLDLRFLTPKE